MKYRSDYRLKIGLYYVTRIEDQIETLCGPVQVAYTKFRINIFVLLVQLALPPFRKHGTSCTSVEYVR